MVAEVLPNNSQEAHPPVVLGLQPAALIDNVAPVDWSLLDQIPGDRGGSIPVKPLLTLFLFIFVVMRCSHWFRLRFFNRIVSICFFFLVGAKG